MEEKKKCDIEIYYEGTCVYAARGRAERDADNAQGVRNRSDFDSTINFFELAFYFLLGKTEIYCKFGSISIVSFSMKVCNHKISLSVFPGHLVSWSLNVNLLHLSFASTGTCRDKFHSRLIRFNYVK